MFFILIKDGDFNNTILSGIKVLSGYSAKLILQKKFVLKPLFFFSFTHPNSFFLGKSIRQIDRLAYNTIDKKIMNGVRYVSKPSREPKLPNKVIDLLVSDIFKKNNIDIKQAKGNISEEQKKMLRELVQDLSQQVDHFLNSSEIHQKSTENEKKSKGKQKKLKFKK